MHSINPSRAIYRAGFELLLLLLLLQLSSHELRVFVCLFELWIPEVWFLSNLCLVVRIKDRLSRLEFLIVE